MKKEKAKVKKPKIEKIIETKVKQTTLKDRINIVVDKVVEIDEENRIKLKKDLFQLVQKELYPDQFCPQCEERLFFNPTTGYNCPNCGYKRALGEQVPVIRSVARPTAGKIDPKLDKAISNVMHPPRRTGGATKLGAKIKKLVDQRDSGGPSAPTPQDEGLVRRDRNVSGKINWV